MIKIFDGAACRVLVATYEAPASFCKNTTMCIPSLATPANKGGPHGKMAMKLTHDPFTLSVDAGSACPATQGMSDVVMAASEAEAGKIFVGNCGHVSMTFNQNPIKTQQRSLMITDGNDCKMFVKTVEGVSGSPNQEVLFPVACMIAFMIRLTVAFKQ